MTNQILYALSDASAEGVAGIAEIAAKKLNPAPSVQPFSYVDNQWDLERVLLRAVNAGDNPIVLYTFQRPALEDYLRNFCDLHKIAYFDVLAPVVHAVQPLFDEASLSSRPERATASQELMRRMDAIDFASRYDDGKDIQGLFAADICLIGISRTTKTPLSMYLANKNYRVINLPLLPETPPPAELFEVSSSKIFGLTVSCDILVATRMARLRSLGLPENAEYASRERILSELQYAHEIMKKIGCAIIDVSTRSVEETADVIIRTLDGRL
ncbi:MAG: pyruvate, phosphate dikinase/phosphoenolpyruvate synthase regulator [Ndongobacter sp.]|nr:pyruvate, phosphate dikinase/phosphoenolpyruvate synthase regulator [Ndongobacter sp.]